MLILYDEPFVGLDPIALNQVLKLIRTLNDTLGITSILVAHEFAAVARDRRSRVPDRRRQGGGAGHAGRAGRTTIRRGRGSSSAARRTARCRSSIRRATTLPNWALPAAATMNARLRRRPAVVDDRRVAGADRRLRPVPAPILRARSRAACATSARRCRQIWFVGAMSLVIIMTCGLFVGMVLGLQLYYVLSIFGGTAALGTVVSLSLYRELGPVVTALLFAGRAGTSITAEIGLMRATDQLSAMEMMAVDPLAYVAAPRFLAGIVAMPLLRLRVQRARHLRRAPGGRVLARPRQRHVLVEHDLQRRCLEGRHQRRVEEPRVRRGGRADRGVPGLHHAADQRGRGVCDHAHGGVLVDRRCWRSIS